ncbi:MAG TPA: addiction module protein [Candidatus Lokiarchaeia archaeon]|nr:addiction module protein [Candidatus Lokiarchaeia archaeon]
MSKIEKIEQEISQLSAQERALLAEYLLQSLDEEEDPDAEQAWIEEAERRYKAYKEGKVRGIPADQVFEDIRSEFE